MINCCYNMALLDEDLSLYLFYTDRQIYILEQFQIICKPRPELAGFYLGDGSRLSGRSDGRSEN